MRLCPVQLGEKGIMPKASLTRFWMMSYGHFTFKASFVLGDASGTRLLQRFCQM
jgi:hypothetical protein